VYDKELPAAAGFAYSEAIAILTLVACAQLLT
jgi:pantoate kinase